MLLTRKACQSGQHTFQPRQSFGQIHVHRPRNTFLDVFCWNQEAKGARDLKPSSQFTQALTQDSGVIIVSCFVTILIMESHIRTFPPQLTITWPTESLHCRHLIYHFQIGNPCRERHFPRAWFYHRAFRKAEVILVPVTLEAFLQVFAKPCHCCWDCCCWECCNYDDHDHRTLEKTLEKKTMIPICQVFPILQKSEARSRRKVQPQA